LSEEAHVGGKEKVVTSRNGGGDRQKRMRGVWRQGRGRWGSRRKGGSTTTCDQDLLLQPKKKGDQTRESEKEPPCGSYDAGRDRGITGKKRKQGKKGDAKRDFLKRGPIGGEKK